MNEILEVHSITKTNSSYGRWAVYCTIKTPYTIARHTYFFFKKKDAEKVKAGKADPTWN